MKNDPSLNYSDSYTAPGLQQKYFEYPLDASLLSSGSLLGVYSIRKLMSTYSGALYKLRRTSNTNSSSTSSALVFANEQGTIYKLQIVTSFNQEVTDTAAISSWLSLSGHGYYVEAWYDQSERKHNMVQTSLSKQPKFVLRSDINLLPSLLFTASALESTIFLSATVPRYGAFGFCDFSSDKSTVGYFGIRSTSNSSRSDYIRLNTPEGYKFAHLTTNYMDTKDVLNGKLLGVASVGFVQDITARRLYAKELVVEKSLSPAGAYERGDVLYVGYRDYDSQGEVDGKECWEIVFLSSAPTDAAALTLSRNQTSFFDRGSKLLLSATSPPAAAYSTRLINASYAGATLRVRSAAWGNLSVWTTDQAVVKQVQVESSSTTYTDSTNITLYLDVTASNQNFVL